MERCSHSVSLSAHCRVIPLPRHEHENGILTVAQNGGPVPFKVRRIFYIYDIPAGSSRGGHSHFCAEELIVAISGCFDVVVDDGHTSATVTLRNPSRGLYVPAGIWRSLSNFSSGAVCLVLTSEKFSEEDYVRDYNEFKKLTSKKERL